MSTAGTVAWFSYAHEQASGSGAYLQASPRYHTCLIFTERNAYAMVKRPNLGQRGDYLSVCVLS